jgi:hypothetical protein
MSWHRVYLGPRGWVEVGVEAEAEAGNEASYPLLLVFLFGYKEYRSFP